MKLICDIKAMELAASELEFDTKRNPLGKVSAAQIKAGYESLARIAELLEEGKATLWKGHAVKEASGQFYTRCAPFLSKKEIVHLFSSSLPRFDKCHQTSRIFPRTEQTFSARSFGVIS